MDDPKIEGVGVPVPVPVSGAIESVSATRESPEDKVEALRRVRVFADLPEDQLKWFAENSQDERYGGLGAARLMAQAAMVAMDRPGALVFKTLA